MPPICPHVVLKYFDFEVSSLWLERGAPGPYPDTVFALMSVRIATQASGRPRSTVRDGNDSDKDNRDGRNQDNDGALELLDRPKTKRPRKYRVVFHNDDYTTMEFVVHALQKFFHKTDSEATQIMLHIHHKGFGVVGVFTRDVAETKAALVMDYAKEHGHPLRCTAEPEAHDGEED